MHLGKAEGRLFTLSVSLAVRYFRSQLSLVYLLKEVTTAVVVPVVVAVGVVVILVKEIDARFLDSHSGVMKIQVF